MAMVLTISGLIMILCILCNKISARLGVPALLIFIVLGMIFGVDGIFKIPFADYAFTEQLCTIALIFIMFYGGFGTNWKMAKPVAVKAIGMSTLGVIVTAWLVGIFCHYVLHFGWLTGMLVGAAISSTDAASVFSILRSRKLDLKEGTASLLEVESGSNDPCSYMLTMIILTLIQGDGSENIGYMIFAQIVYGLVFGVLIALCGAYVLKKVKFTTEGFDGIFVFALALLSYALPSVLGGNGYLSVYIAGLIMGNQPIKNKTTLVNFFDSLTGLAQMMIFFLLGLLSYPSRMIGLLGTSLPIALFLTFAARPLAVMLILTPLRCSFRQQLLVAWAGLRGAASIVFAIMVVISGASPQGKLFDIVFCVVLFSIAVQGTLLPLMAKILRMVDEDEDVSKTFNDYSEETEIQFIKIAVTENHGWANQEIRNLVLPPDTLLAMVCRGEDALIPGGSTMLLPGDTAVLAAPVFHDNHQIQLNEMRIGKNHEWQGKKISELDLPLGNLIVLIKRSDGHTVVPQGSTEIEKDDVLVVTAI